MNAGKSLIAVLALGLGFGSVGCQTHTGTGALIGGAGGALAGAAIGSHSHSNAGAGALVGGTIGAIGGAIVGNEMDRQEQGPRYAYSRPYDDGGYYVERRVYRPRYDDCPPPRYEYRTYRYGRGGGYYYGY